MRLIKGKQRARRHVLSTRIQSPRVKHPFMILGRNDRRKKIFTRGDRRTKACTFNINIVRSHVEQYQVQTTAARRPGSRTRERPSALSPAERSYLARFQPYGHFVPRLDFNRNLFFSCIRF